MTIKTMSGEELIQQFEDGKTPPATFHHADHIRLAFEYLCRHPVLTGIERFSSALRRFAVTIGRPQLYHETITWAYLLLIHERIARVGQPLAWDEFAARNRDLLVWKGGVLSKLYRPETLESDLAKKVFLLPDQVTAAAARPTP